MQTPQTTLPVPHGETSGSVGRARGRTIRRLIRAASARVYEKVAAWLSGVSFRLKCWMYEIKCGRGVYVFGPVMIRSGGGAIEIGDDVALVSSSWRCSSASLARPLRLRTFLPSARIIFDNGSGMNGGSVTARSHTIRIGRNTMIGPDCSIFDSDFHPVWPPEDRLHYSGTDLDEDVWIGDNVWLGARCLVLKGVTIGDNSVIAAGSVVVKDVPPNALAGGNPARVLRILDGGQGSQVSEVTEK